MFGSKKTLDQLRLEHQREFEKAAQRYQLTMSVIGALPSGSPAPEHVHDFGYCAEAGLIFEGKGIEQKLLALYPPLPLVAVTGVISGAWSRRSPSGTFATRISRIASSRSIRPS